MIAWVVGAPLIFFVMMLVLDRLETNVVMPVDRAAKISKWLEQSSADELERRVAAFLSNAAPSRQHAVPR